MRWSLEEDKILYDYLAEYDSEAAENTDVHCKRKCKCTATQLVLHAPDMQEIPFSPKIGRRKRDFYASNMPGEKSDKLFGLLSFSEHIFFISIHILAFSGLN